VEKAALWELETLTLESGATYHGLIESQGEGEVKFVVVGRPRGKPLYLVRMSFDARSVNITKRLPDQARRELLEKIHPLLETKSHALIEAGRMEDVALAEVTREGTSFRLYDGQWFTLLSTSDELTTRRCVVRIEQIFRAYRQVLPPRADRESDLQIVLYGSLEEYQKYLRKHALEIENPAFFSGPKNLIVAGSDLSRYAERLAQVLAHNQTVQQHMDELNSDFSRQLGKLSNQLRQSGFSTDEIRFEMNARKGAWEKEYAAMIATAREVRRRNDAKFADVTQKMFARLYHEAFHAYLQNYVYPQPQYQVPRWLNEGLAQIFENGQFDNDTLRIDAPSREMLLPLQTDLLSGNSLKLATLLSADEQEFLRAHGDGSSERHYLYCWGLAYYLTFQQDLLGGETLDRYVSAESSGLSPIARFEQLVAMPLPQFEHRWQAAMVALKPPPR
jgi:hypothetical protein